MSDSPTKIVYLTAGAGGMFCGSCMHDNALAKSLAQLGFDIQLVPTYTPIRTDEDDVSVDQVFFGGINVYLQQKFPLVRWLPAALDRFLDNPKLIRRVTSKTIDMPPNQLGSLAVSMLKGLRGNQRKEVKRLSRWLSGTAKPDIVIFSNALIGGCIPELKRNLGKPVLVTLQGDDVFLDSLPNNYRDQCIQLIREISGQVDGFIVHSQFFREYMADYFSIPIEKIHVTPLGIDHTPFAKAALSRQSAQPTIGYLARFAPEKGFDQIISAFIELKNRGTIPGLKLRLAGWLGAQNEAYFQQQMARLGDAFKSDVDYLGAIEREEKIDFLSSIDVLSVPTKFQEPKGLYALEAMACGVPVVQPDHGAFSELIEQSQGGVLFQPGNIQHLCDQLTKVLVDPQLRKKLSDNAIAFISEQRTADAMGIATSSIIQQLVS